MAKVGRPQKRTVEWYKHECDPDNVEVDLTTRLSRTFGNDGYAIFHRLKEALCCTDGQYLDIRGRLALEDLADDFYCSVEVLRKVLEVLAYRGWLHGPSWEAGYIYSQMLIDRLSVWDKRAGGPPTPPVISDAETRISESETPISDAESQFPTRKPQFQTRKVKESGVSDAEIKNQQVLPSAHKVISDAETPISESETPISDAESQFPTRKSEESIERYRETIEETIEGESEREMESEREVSSKLIVRKTPREFLQDHGGEELQMVLLRFKALKDEMPQIVEKWSDHLIAEGKEIHDVEPVGVARRRYIASLRKWLTNERQMSQRAGRQAEPSKTYIPDHRRAGGW